MNTHASVQLSVLTPHDAPQRARPLLDAAAAKYGFVPNLLGILANAPAALEGYLTLAGIFESSSLTAAERQVVLLATSRHNECGYCMSAHTAIASMQQVDSEVVCAMREDSSMSDPKLQALRAFAADVVESRGRPGRESLDALFAAGYTSAHALEVILGVTVKTLSNYVNHLADTPLDTQFTPVQWAAPAR